MKSSTKTSLALCALLLTIGAAACGSKPAETTTPAGTTPVKVTEVSIGRAIGADKAISDSTDNFKPSDTIYASVLTDGTASSATVRVKWTFEDGQTVDESTKTIAPSGRERTEFHISKPNGWPAGKYKVEVFLNDQSSGTKSFDVKS
jgi:hypothetical protein